MSSPPRWHRRPDRQRDALQGRAVAAADAFTLIELLVVIGIISVLIALLLPALAAARRQAQLTHCLSVERQIGMAASLHAQTHHGFYPLAGMFDLPSSGQISGARPSDVGDPDQRRYTYIVVHETTMNGTTIAPWPAALAYLMGKRTATNEGSNIEFAEEETGQRTYLKYFICPSQVDAAIDAPNAVVYEAGNLIWMVQQSYVINEVVFGWNDSMGRLRGQASRVRRPAETAMLADGMPGKPRSGSFRQDLGWVTFVNKTPRPPITLADALADNNKAGDKESFDRIRHRGRINILFFDGHAETRQIDPRDLEHVFLMAN